MERIFGPGGILQQSLEGFEHRPSQLEMALAVLEAVSERHSLCVEAGTGTGKTLAYLIPALYSRKRVIVSTATKNLQDQLFRKDIPFIRENLFPDLRVTYMKGRQNYLCVKRFKEQPAQLLPIGDLRERWDEIGRWAASSETGDRAELDWIGDQDALWQTLDARSEACVGQKCPWFDECFVTRMRRKAVESDLIVVNHALFFANLALESDEIGKILPDFGVLILDEAHEIEDIAANHFGRQISNYQFEELARDVASAFRGRPKIPKPLARLDRTAEALFERVPGPEGRHSLSFHRNPDNSVVDLREELAGQYRDLRTSLDLLYSQLQLETDRPDAWEALERRLLGLSANLDEVFALEQPDSVYWFEKRRKGVFLHVTPIDIATLMRERLFKRTDTTILTSATLTTNGDFTFVRARLGVTDPVELAVPGEFDYQNQALLYVPSRFPEPASPHYFHRALSEIRQLLRISGGGAFLLFTSYQQMRRIHEALAGNLPYPLLLQGEMPKNRILETFRTTPNAVLCATSSFWQGVDVRGEALRAVVIDKLPFQVPTEPVVAARLHRLESDGENAFLNYTLPNAIITLKQGLGRLIRSRQDRGILAILDSRLRTRRYGEAILQSLPNCPLTDNMTTLGNFFQAQASSSFGGKQI